jgi:hypothetical protein
MTSKIRRLVIVGGMGAVLLGLIAGSAQAAPPPTPTPTTLPATGVGTTTATLNGTVATGGQAVLWQFQYGKTTLYGRRTAIRQTPSGQGAVFVSVKVGRLTPGTRYHFVMLTENGGQNGTGTAYYPLNFYFGQDRSFVTKRLGALRITSSKLSVRHGTAAIPVACASTQSCRGKLTLTVRIGRRTVVLARKSLRLAAGRKATLKPRLSRTGQIMLADAPGQRLAVRVNGRFSTGQPKFSKRVTLILK